MAKYLTPITLAKKLGKTLDEINTMRAKGTGPPYLLDGEKVIYDMRDVEAWIKKEESKEYHKQLKIGLWAIVIAISTAVNPTFVLLWVAIATGYITLITLREKRRKMTQLEYISIKPWYMRLPVSVFGDNIIFVISAIGGLLGGFTVKWLRVLFDKW